MRCFFAVRSTVVSIPNWVRVLSIWFFSSRQLCTLAMDWLVEWLGASRESPPRESAIPPGRLSHDEELRRASHLSCEYLQNSVTPFHIYLLDFFFFFFFYKFNDFSFIRLKWVYLWWWPWCARWGRAVCAAAAAGDRWNLWTWWALWAWCAVATPRTKRTACPLFDPPSAKEAILSAARTAGCRTAIRLGPSSRGNLNFAERVSNLTSEIYLLFDNSFCVWIIIQIKK